MNDCIFCKIIKKEIPKEFTFESDNLVVFPDINPSAEVHLLIVPKQHILGVQDLGSENSELLSQIYQVANNLVKQYNLSGSLYRIVVNGGKAQHVSHLHFHLLGGNLRKKEVFFN